MVEPPVNALYCRVSTDMQKEKGESIKNQISRLQEYALEKNLTAEIYKDEGYSAKDTNRPELKRLLRDIKEGKVISVTVTKLDRITRNIRDLVDLLEVFEEYGVKFKSLTQTLDTSTAMSRGFIRLLGEFAQMEREMTSERVGEDMRHRAKNGKWNGGVVPYGYTVHAIEVKKLINTGLSRELAEIEATKITPEKKKLYVCQKEADVVKQIFDKYIKLESLRGVTQWLNSAFYKTRNNKTWASASISRILTNQVYIGRQCYNKRVSSKTTGKLKKRPKDEWIISEGQHAPIIKEDIFNKVQDIIKKQFKEPRRKMSNYLLSGFVRCGKCNGALNGYTQKKLTSKGVKLYSYYKCHTYQSKGNAVCTGNSIGKEFLEELVVGRILELTTSDKFKVDIKQALEKFNKRVEKEESPLRNEKNKLTLLNTKIEQKQKTLLECLEDGTINKETYKNRILELNSEFEKNQKSLFEIESKINDIGIENISFNCVYETVKNFKSNWPNFDFLSKKELLWSIISKVVVENKKIQLDLFFLPTLFSNFRSCMDRGSWRI